MNVNLEYYKVFYYVSRFGSLTAAAEELCISQPAVSQAVRQLERAAGVKLFIRTSKGVQLTREGEQLAIYVKKGVESLMEGERLLERMLNLDLGEVRIGASDMTLQFFLLPYLEQFHQENPGIKVVVTNAPTPETIASLEAGKIDFGVVSTPFDCKKEITSIPVQRIHNAFVAGSRFSHLKDRVLDYECLRELPCIFLEEKTSTRRFMDDFLAENHVVLTPEFELATSDMVVQFARRNMGVGCVMSEFARSAVEAGDLFWLQFEKPMPERSFCVVTGRSNLISVAAGKLLEMITREKPIRIAGSRGVETIGH